MLKLSVSGFSHELQAFVKHFTTQPYYKIKTERNRSSKGFAGKMKSVIEFTTSLLKPSIRRTTAIELTLPDAKQIKFDLLDCKVERSSTKVTKVSGLHYDIFS
jgi:hypothetical protein